MLLPNPNYGGDRPRRWARIVYTLDVPTPHAVALVDRGKLDYLPPDFDGPRCSGATACSTTATGPGAPPPSTAGSATSPPPGSFLDYIVLNANRPLFRDVRLRRAVDYALDRPALAAAYRDVPSDQIVPPSVRRLPGRGGVSGRQARPRDRTAPRRQPAPARGAHLLHVLPVRRRRPPLGRAAREGRPRADRDRRLDRAHRRVPDGLRRELEPGRPAARDELRLAAPRPRSRTSMRRSRAAAYASALGPGPWAAPSFRRRLEAASALRGPARTAAYARLERELMRAAPFAVYGTFSFGQYLSPRIGCRVTTAATEAARPGALPAPLTSSRASR